MREIRDLTVDGTPRLAGFLLILVELVLIAAVIRLFEIESQRHFFPVYCLVAGGFAVHFWLPTSLRLPFFALLSLAGSFFVLGLESGGWLLGIGLSLIAVCHLPLPKRLQVALLISVAVVLCTLRAWFPMPFWPVLGSMFMFRLILYVYERRNATDRRPLAESIAYFFMLPNVCFPLFPIVDYRTFRESRYDENELAIYQRGVTWSVRGLTHLLLYRFIKQEIVPAPYELDDISPLALYMASNYALYLQVSGQFHLITGLLHLFGFNLPRTHHLFFLASSFSDIWRRINIYWKDFLTKIVFYPTFHFARVRRISTAPAIVMGVMSAFLATWLLHSWQTFWLLGHFPVTANDAGLWIGAGLLVAVNSLVELRRGPRRERPEWRHAIVLSLQIVSMFMLVSLFWAAWTNPGFLGLVWGIARRPGAVHGFLVVGGWLLGAVAVLTVARLGWKMGAGSQKDATALPFQDSVKLHVVGLGLLIVVSRPSFGNLCGEDVARAIADFRTFSAEEAASGQLQSYYEDLNTARVQAGPLMRSLSPGDEVRRRQAFGFEKVSRETDIAQETELIPGLDLQIEGKRFTTNAYGMRDRRTLSLIKPAGTKRIAIVGSSIVMGYGVADEEVFPRLFEDRLNARPGRRDRIEVLNFGVGSQWAPQRLVRIQRMVFAFEPDILYYIAHQDEWTSVAKHPARLVAQGMNLPSPYLDEVVERAGVRSNMAWGAIEKVLLSHQDELLLANYKAIVEECRRHGVTAVYIYLPVPDVDMDPGVRLQSLASEAGFHLGETAEWAAGVTAEDIYAPTDDVHPDAAGHRLIAEALLQMFESQPETRP